VRTVVFQAGLLALIASFSALAVLASTSAYLPIDVVITRTLQLNRSIWVETFMQIISWPGYTIQAACLVATIAAILYLFGLHWESVMSLIAAAGVTGLNYLVKTVIARPRPPSDLVTVFQTLSSFSFPSGHVMFYTAYFGFLFYLVYTLLRHSWIRTLLLILFGALVLLVGVSRIYLGEHWASDVIGGYLLGTIALAGVVRVYHWGETRFFVRQPVASEPP
jgi:undecaprenyl-diphosphatase